MDPHSTHQHGTVRVHPRGFGFLIPDSDPAATAFISPPDLNRFMDDDRVEADIVVAADGRVSARAIRLVERRRERVFGKVVSHRGGLHVQVDRKVANRDWPLDAEPGSRPELGAFIVARVSRDRLVLERRLDASADPAVERIIARHELPTDFPDDVRGESARVREDPGAAVERRDLRDVPTVTVDASTSRDLDDAISVLGADADGAVRLLVSISDVSAWVTPGSTLDREALRRATSVYLPDRVLPMLPTELSEERLSLLPGRDRACVTVELRITPEGEVSSVDVYRSLIRSWTRLTYEQAAAFLDTGALAAEHASVGEMLAWCRTAWARLSMSRARRGGVQLAREEARVGIDSETGRATVLDPYALTTAHEMIERFMVAANEAVARWLSARGVPVPYRVHDEPTATSVERLEVMARNFGFRPGLGSNLTPLGLSAFERQVRAAPAAPAILAVLGKTLGRARYTVHPSLHFGLATDRYLHFTSPIRRYADLLVHRAIRGYLDGQRPADPRPEALEAICEDLNIRSGRAARAEVQSRRAIGARYMAARIGDVFDANVTSVLPQGLRVQVIGSLVVGWVGADTLPAGPYEMHEASQELVGANRSYGVGMPVRVRLDRADELQGAVDFSIVG